MNFPNGLEPDAQNDTNTSLLAKQCQMLYNLAVDSGTSISGGMQFPNGLAPDAQNDTNTSLLFKICQLLYDLQQSGGGPVPDLAANWLATSGLTGNPISAWSDGTNILTASGTARPAVGTNFKTGHSVDFDGTSDTLEIDPNPIASVTGSLGLVLKTGASVGGTILYSVDAGVTSDTRFSIDGVVGQNAAFMFESNGESLTCLDTIPQPNTEYQILITLGGTDSIDLRIWVNDVEQTFNEIGSGPLHWFTDDDLYIGATHIPDDFFPGSIGVIRFWNHVLSTGERSDWSTYANGTWLTPPGPAMDLIFMGAGTNDAIVTPTSLDAGTIGSTTGWGAWGRDYHNPLEHTRVRNQQFVRRTPVSQNGTNYDGTGFKAIEFNLTDALVLASSPLYEGYKRTFPAGLTGGLVMTGLAKFETLFGSNNVNFDAVEFFFTGGWCIMQCGSRFGDTQTVAIHSQFGGNSKNGNTISIPDQTKVYCWTMQADVTNQYNRLLIVDNATGTIIGTSESPSDVGELNYLEVQDYLLGVASGGGKITHGMIGAAYTTQSFPCESGLVVPVPSSLVLIQSDIDELLLTWTSVVQRVSVDRRVNGGAWTTVNASFDYFSSGDSGYRDSTVSDGSTYEYRIRAVVGSLTSDLSSASSSVTVDNSTFPTAHDDFESYVNNTSLEDEPNWTAANTTSVCIVGTKSGATTKTVRPSIGGLVNAAVFWNADTFNDNQRSEITIGNVGSTGDLEIISAAVRIQSGADTWYDVGLKTVFSTTTIIVLRKVAAGTDTELQTSTTPIASGDILAIEVSGTGASTRLKVQKNVGAGFVDVWTNQDPGGTYLSSGQAGMGAKTQFGGSPAFNGITVEEWRGYNK